MAAGIRALLIAGPTASGKSALAVELAERMNGVIVNADSMQVYQELSIITARPSPEDLARVPHRLYGVVPAGVAFSTGDWLRRVADEIAAVEADGRMPVLVGGTGLYFKALTEGFADLPDIDPAVRAECRLLAEEGGLGGVRLALGALDPDAAATLMDLQRMTRALEVVRATGKRLSVWQREAQGASLYSVAETARLVLTPPRPWLYERISRRAALMLASDGLAEIEALLALGLPDTLPAMRAIGVKESRALLSGEIDPAEALAQLTIATRQYAKRQETWFRNQMPDWQRLDPAQSCAQGLALEFMRKIGFAYP